MAKSKSSGATAKTMAANRPTAAVKTVSASAGLTEIQQANKRVIGKNDNGALSDIKNIRIGEVAGNQARIDGKYWYAPDGQDYLELRGSRVEATIERNPYRTGGKWSLSLRTARNATSFESDSVDALIKKAHGAVR